LGVKGKSRNRESGRKIFEVVLGVDARTPGYLVREELRREKLRGRAGKRAWKFEKRLEEGRGSKIVRECREEMRSRGKKGRVMVGWEEERRNFFEVRGVRIEEVEKRGMEDGKWIRELEKRDEERQKDERRRKIRESGYNKWYKEVKGEGIPSYLKKGWEESRWKKIVRYRLGNEMREGRYWEEGEKRRCRLCRGEEET